MESCVEVRCLDNGPTPTYVDAGLPRIDSHDCVRRRTLTCVNVRWRRTLPRLLNAHECNIVLRRRTSAYVVLVAVLRWRRTTLVLGIVLGLSEKNGSPTTQKSYDSVWPRLYWRSSVLVILNMMMPWHEQPVCITQGFLLWDSHH